MTAAELVQRLQGVKGGNGTWTARCPAHDDTNPSLSITDGRDGRVLLKCHGGCSLDAIVGAMGLQERDLFNDQAHDGKRGAPLVDAEYPYVDEQGTLLYHVVRFKPKDFRQRAASGAWSLKDVRRVLYRLPQLLEAVANGRTVFVVEGEKDVHALADHGIVATTNAGGAGPGKWLADYTTAFAGARVVILPDNDDVGEAHAVNVAQQLLPVAQDVRILHLPGVPPKGDVSDWLSAGGSKKQLAELLEAAPIFSPPLAALSVLKLSSGPQAATQNEALVDPNPQRRTSTARRLGDWLSDKALLIPPDEIIPRLVVSGRVTLLSGREKVGKSTLVAGAVTAASLGAPVLGVALDRPRQTLWYAIDEPIADTARRFESLGADMQRIIINTDPRTQSELLAALDIDLATFAGVDLVVVDTLSRVFSASGVNPNQAHEVEPLLSRLVDFVHSQGVAAILLYHTGKAGKEYRGSTGIGAVVDDILTLRRRGATEEDDFDDDAADDGRRLLVRVGRNLKGRIQLSCVGGVYGIYEDAFPLRTRLLETLRTHDSVRTHADLVKFAGVRKADGMRTVNELIAAGAISNGARGQLRLTPFGLAELGARVPVVPASFAGREPNADNTQFPSSLWFPEGGTDAEPFAEPTASADSTLGSRSVHPPHPEMGTAALARVPAIRVRV